jgi:hypothetical protein
MIIESRWERRCRKRRMKIFRRSVRRFHKKGGCPSVVPLALFQAFFQRRLWCRTTSFELLRTIRKQPTASPTGTSTTFTTTFLKYQACPPGLITKERNWLQSSKSVFINNLFLFAVGLSRADENARISCPSNGTWKGFHYSHQDAQHGRNRILLYHQEECQQYQGQTTAREI